MKEMYEVALVVMRRINNSIGVGPTLTDEERKALLINGRVQTYLMNRIERGNEIFEKEKKEAGKSTKEYDS